ncbi:MAG TPA: sensor histidine kinase, partial [Flavisolibacter sp.]
MPVRIRITLLFTGIVFVILGLVCVTVYYFNVNSRRNYIETRLTNLALTTGRFLSRAETFSPRILQKIDSLTAIAFTHKTVMAFDQHDRKIYSFNDDDADTIVVDTGMLRAVRSRGRIYQTMGDKDVVFYHYNQGADLVVVAAGYDIFGRQTIRSLLYILLLSFFFGLCIA